LGYADSLSQRHQEEGARRLRKMSRAVSKFDSLLRNSQVEEQFQEIGRVPRKLQPKLEHV
jgi:hypothetical protein